MNQNSLIEIGSKANVILKCNVATYINGTTYAAGEPYLYLQDVAIAIDYRNYDKNGSAIETVIANSTITPKKVSLSNVSFSRKICSLIAAFQNTNTAYNYTLFKTLVADGTSLYLTDAIDSTEAFYVYDSSFAKVANVSYATAPNSLTSANFVSGDQYLVSFFTPVVSTKFNLDQPCSLPYMSMEIQGIGNVDKISKKILIYFEKVSLNSMPQFNFMYDNVINVPLVFHIIKGNNYITIED